MISRSLSYYLKYKLDLYNQPYTCLHTNYTFYIIKVQFENRKVEAHMTGNRLGQTIHQLRKEKGITQEELGSAVGVTAQAVSNWECGGMPDAGLLPGIAEYFGVTIDHLYGKTDEVKQNLGQQLVWDLCHTKKEERFEKAYQYCWHIQKGLFDMEPELVNNILQENTGIPDSTKTISTLSFEEGISCLRMNKNVHHFFLMPTPEDGLKENLLNPEQYEHFFEVLGRPGRMRALLFVYGKKALAFSCERLARQMSLSVEETERTLEDLCELDILYKLEVDTEDGEVTYYKAVDYYHCIVFLIPFLYAASELMEKAVCGFNNTSKTGKSLL